MDSSKKKNMYISHVMYKFVHRISVFKYIEIFTIKLILNFVIFLKNCSTKCKEFYEWTGVRRMYIYICLVMYIFLHRITVFIYILKYLS